MGSGHRLVLMVLSCAMFFLFPDTCHGAANLPCGTYIITGGVKNSRNALFGPDEGLSLQAVSTNGDVLAASALFSPYGTGSACNFSLRVPLSTTATDRTAAVGDSVNLVLKIGNRLAVAANPVVLCRANAVTNIFVQVVDTVAYTNQKEKVVYVSRDYLDEIAPWLSYLGRKVYDPFGDWDGDGSLNYQEYWNGTDPVDPTDYLRIIDARMTAKGNFAISFEYVGGHVYGLLSSASLASAKWAARDFKSAETATLQKQISYAETDDEADIRTIYVVPAATSTNEFFKVEVK